VIIDEHSVFLYRENYFTDFIFRFISWIILVLLSHLGDLILNWLSIVLITVGITIQLLLLAITVISFKSDRTIDHSILIALELFKDLSTCYDTTVNQVVGSVMVIIEFAAPVIDPDQFLQIERFD